METTMYDHVGIRVGNLETSVKFYKAGGRDNGAPGARKDYSPSYFAAFLIDPDGNNVEAVHS
jgi:catechol 2,3-dioxygenase-like lactoylglutathione lyase family enzyme